MHSTDYQKDASETGGLIYTTEQWFRSLQGRIMDCDRVTKPLSNSSDSILLSNDFLKHGWYLTKRSISALKLLVKSMKIEPKKFKCIECSNKFDTYVEKCSACGANLLQSEDVQKKSTQLMLIVLTLSSTSTILYFIENTSMKIFSGIFACFAVFALYKLFKSDWDR